MNTFGLEGGFNSSLGNNNNYNSPSGEVDPNIAALVNALMEMNLIGGYFSREGSFVKPTEFARTETKDLNEWLERFNQIVEAN